MRSAAMTRRRFLEVSTRLGLGVGVAGSVLDPAGLERLFGLAGRGDAVAAGALDELIRRAPAARYWTSAGTAAPDCRGCHADPDFDVGAAHDHADPDLRRQAEGLIKSASEPAKRLLILRGFESILERLRASLHGCELHSYSHRVAQRHGL